MSGLRVTRGARSARSRYRQPPHARVGAKGRLDPCRRPSDHSADQRPSKPGLRSLPSASARWSDPRCRSPNRKETPWVPFPSPVGRVPYFLSSPSSLPRSRRSPDSVLSSTPGHAAGGRDQGRPLRSARRHSRHRPVEGRRHHTCATASSRSRRSAPSRRNSTGDPSFPTARSFARCRCRRVPMRMTSATYDKGILTVSVAVSEPKPAEKHVQVQSAS